MMFTMIMTIMMVVMMMLMMIRVMMMMMLMMTMMMVMMLMMTMMMVMTMMMMMMMMMMEVFIIIHPRCLLLPWIFTAAQNMSPSPYIDFLSRVSCCKTFKMRTVHRGVAGELSWKKCDSARASNYIKLTVTTSPKREL